MRDTIEMYVTGRALTEAEEAKRRRVLAAVAAVGCALLLIGRFTEGWVRVAGWVLLLSVGTMWLLGRIVRESREDRASSP